MRLFADVGGAAGELAEKAGTPHAAPAGDWAAAIGHVGEGPARVNKDRTGRGVASAVG
jgi:hypothetical protein